MHWTDNKRCTHSQSNYTNTKLKAWFRRRASYAIRSGKGVGLFHNPARTHTGEFGEWANRNSSTKLNSVKSYLFLGRNSEGAWRRLQRGVGRHLAMPASTSDDVDCSFCGVEPRRERSRVLPTFLRNSILLLLSTSTTLWSVQNSYTRKICLRHNSQNTAKASPILGPCRSNGAGEILQTGTRGLRAWKKK